ncbi:hypothetical protein [Methanolacinia petrolearia]|uniref:hypothetical protein n=1 Tax=Methanolacinia petrolearia TaxID=54120 RepID=UPI003BA91C7B
MVEKAIDVMTGARETVTEKFPKVLVKFAIAFLIWLFAVYIFLPLSGYLSDPTFLGLIGLDKLIAAIVMIALLIILLAVLKDIKAITDAIASYAAVAILRKGTIDEKNLKKYQYGFRGLAYVLVAVIAYLFFLPFITSIFNVLAGIVLIVIIMWAIVVLLRVGEVFSDDIERKTSDFLKEIEYEVMQSQESKPGKK